MDEPPRSVITADPSPPRFMSHHRPLEFRQPRVVLVAGGADTRQILMTWAERVGGSVSSFKDLPEALEQPLHECEAVVVDAAVTWHALSASLDRLRAAMNTTPLLVITKSTAAEDASAGLTAGDEDFLVLPYDTEELVGRLERLLVRAGHSRPDSVLRYEDLEVDVVDRLCRVGGDRVRLTPKELGILEALLRVAPRTLSRQQLLEEVWTEDTERGRKALDVHMTHLRKKLAGAYSRASVSTVRGTGFRVGDVRVELPTHLVLEAAPDAMLVADEDGEILMVNAMLESMFGYERSEMLGASVETLIPERMRGGHRRQRSRFDDAPAPRRMGTGLELLGRHRDGTEFPVDVSLSPIETHQGRYVIAAVRMRIE